MTPAARSARLSGAALPAEPDAILPAHEHRRPHPRPTCAPPRCSRTSTTTSSSGSRASPSRGRLGADETLFLQGDAADAFYLLAEGRLKVFKLLRDGRTATVRHVEPGQTFAEAALFHETYPSSTETLTDCLALPLRQGARRWRCCSPSRSSP